MELVKKEVNFHNDKIFTVMKDGKLYVGVSEICLNLGMSKKMKDRQVTNVQNDIVLSKGCLKFEAGVFDPNNSTLAVEIEFLPIWLAKIRITPNMIEEKKELVNKLIDYQLHCKSILADEFFGKREIVSPDKNAQRFNPDLNDIEDRIPLIRESENELFQIYEKLKYHYHWIFSRSSNQEDKIVKYMKELREKFFIHDGKEMTTLEIDRLNNK